MNNSVTAQIRNVPVSAKQCIEIAKYLKKMNTIKAKKILEETMGLKHAIPFKTFNCDMGHRPGIASGRYPQKAASFFLNLIKSAESNAEDNGLNVEQLQITSILANRAPRRPSGGRVRGMAKRAHIQIELTERAGDKQ